MYNKTIKKSIAFITLLSIVFSCFSTFASSTSSDENFTVTFPDYNLSADYIIDTHPDPADPNHYFITKYRVSITPWIYFKNNGYVNGRFYIPVTVSINNPNGSNIPDDIKIEPKSLLSENIYSTQLWTTSPNSGSFYIYTYFNNYYNSSINNWVPIEPFYFEFSLQCTTNSENNIQLSFVTGDFSDTCTYSNSPSNTGLADIITDSIVEALGSDSYVGQQYYSSPLYYLSMLLIGLGTVQSNQDLSRSILNSILNNLSTLQGYVDGVEGFLTNIYNKLTLLYDNIDDIIDTISWNNLSYTNLGYSSTIDGEYSIPSSGAKSLKYWKFSFNTSFAYNGILKIKTPFHYNGSVTRFKNDYEIKLYTIVNGNFVEIELDYYSYTFSNDCIELYLNFYNMHASNYILYINASYGMFTRANDTIKFEYIPSTDIEYWFIKSYMELYKLNHTGEKDTQAQNELIAAATQMEQAAAAMDVTKPNPNSVLPESLVSGDITAAQGTLFSWLNNNYILSILIACFTIALIGFVIYGKSG